MKQFYNFEGITEAFNDLQIYGIIAKENYKCCQTCAYNEISKYPFLGYCFYHQQDTDLAEKTGELMITFGGLPQEDPFDDIQIGKTIIKVLRQHNLNVSWSEDVTQRILVTLPLPDLFKE
jgi:hypothetical protein